MTLPLTKILPRYSDRLKDKDGGLDEYFSELIFSLQSQYEDVAQAVNGDIRSDQETGSRQYVPTISGSSGAGAGTYTHQTGWVLREGIMVDVFGDIRWSAHTGTGTMQVDLPYQCAVSANQPFVAVVAAQNITFTGYLTGIVNPGTRVLQIQDNRSGTTFSNIAVTNADTTLRIHVRYIGQTIERS